jgi:glycosyltransferase involved in cell wall biosynthesis
MESGIDKKGNILILTSFLSNDNSSKMIKDVSKSLENIYNVDVLSKYAAEIEGLNIYSAYSNYEKLLHNAFSYVNDKFLFYKSKYFKVVKKEATDYYFFGLNEKNPPVNPKRIISKINKQYDFILVFFWQGLLTSKSLKDIYNELNTPILLMAADMFPMTGGCSYFWECNRLEKSCGQCPGIYSIDENDVTRKNFLFKKEMIESINCNFLGNSWQINHASKSGLFKNMDKIYPIVDEGIFRPRYKDELKTKFGCLNKTVLFFGSLGVHDPRKGFKYLLKSLQLVSQKRPDLVPDIVLVVAGKGDEVAGLENFNVKYTGHLSFDELAEYYAMADLFLSPSIQDAGPMMLNQALMCGTPAVAFNIGTACDIISAKTGYLANYRDSEDFGNGIIELITKSKDELALISQECREQSLNRSSYKAFREHILIAFDHIK